MSFTTNDSKSSSSSNAVQPCCCFSFAEIQSATRNFDDELIIGQGGFGKVYRGCISIDETSHVVAIKRLDSMSNQGEPEFRAEIEMLSKLRHCHLVSLIGFCDDNGEMILVYDYMPNGTLHDHLHKVDTSLSWDQRLKIAIGAARGLDYLHTGVGTQHGVIHRDIKSSNILLDENMEARISDFGLSKMGPTNQSASYLDTHVKGTFGYLDPEYFYTTRLTRKTDVFAFGVVLFELLSGRLPVDMGRGEEQCSLVRWAQKCVNQRKLDQLVDSRIKGTISPKILKQFAQIAYRCILGVPMERPPMTEVVASLQGLLELENYSDISSESSSVTAFVWKIHKHLVSLSKQYSDESGTSSPKSIKNMNHLEELVTTDVKMLTYDELKRATSRPGNNTCFDESGTISAKSLENNMNQHEELVVRDVKMFTYHELKRATGRFGVKRCIGEDNYGKLYKGWVDKTTYSPCKRKVGLPIVVKKLHHHTLFDLEKLKEFRHPNLVQLIGYCLKGVQLFLVYEFMQNGNFEDLLRSGAVAQLPLITKVKIALGIARGIVFLHQTRPEVGKSLLDRRKILLDKDFVAKLSDYDITLLVDGHYSEVLEYIDDYYYPGLKPFKLWNNIFGFEVVFAEVITGEQIPNSNKMGKIERFFTYFGNKSLRQIVELCYISCNEVDSESKMVTFLNEFDELIRTKLKSWLLDPKT